MENDVVPTGGDVFTQFLRESASCLRICERHTVFVCICWERAARAASICLNDVKSVHFSVCLI